MSAICRQRTARSGPTMISQCRGRSTVNPKSTSKRSSRRCAAPTGCFSRPTPTARARRSRGTCRKYSNRAGRSKDVDVKRVVFNEVTRNAVVEAFRRPRDIDRELVDAYLARRALDYLVGFTLSPVLWRKLPGSRSAGRVQSVALRLICEREAEIEAFKPREYWTVEVVFAHRGGAELYRAADPSRRQAARPLRSRHRSEGARRRRCDLAAPRLCRRRHRGRQVRRNPFPPFTTSTLQQEASRKLGLGATPHDADRPAALRGRRARRRDGRADHLYAHRRRRDFGRGDRRRARR